MSDDTQKLPVAKALLAQNAETSETVEAAKEPAPGKNGTKAHTALVASKPAPPIEKTEAVKKVGKPALSDKKLKAEQKKVSSLYDRCRQLGNTLFWQKQTTTHSLGFTSAIKGEGKTFLAVAMACVLAEESARSVLLVECTWDQPQFHQLFDCPTQPGLAEFLRGECSRDDVLHRVMHNLIIVPAGDVKNDAAKLLQLARQRGVQNLFGQQYVDELFLLDLPPVLTSPYGAMAAELAEALCLVVRSGVTSEALVSEACTHLQLLPVRGVILNEVESRIPRWIRQLL